jgi:hypothetical protein
MSRRSDILAETLAHLEAERFSGPRRPEVQPAGGAALQPPVTAGEAERNAALLLAAITDDDTLIDFYERTA